MAGKRKKKARTREESLGTPSKWRLQHGGFSEPVREADPETGTPVLHRRAIDTLGMMLANGTITPQMHEAGRIFRTLFRSSTLDGMATSQLMRLAGATGGDPMTERQIAARRRIAAAMDALGGHDSAAGSCAWHVVGHEISVREWAMRQGWGGRPVAPPQAQGILVATLSVLAGHFGLVPRARAA